MSQYDTLDRTDMKAWLVTVRTDDGIRRFRVEADDWDTDDHNNLLFFQDGETSQVFAFGQWFSFKAVPWERPVHEMKP